MSALTSLLKSITKAPSKTAAKSAASKARNAVRKDPKMTGDKEAAAISKINDAFETATSDMIAKKPTKKAPPMGVASERSKARSNETAAKVTEKKSTINPKRSVSATDIREATTANQLDDMQRRIDDLPAGNRKKMMQDLLDRQLAKFEGDQAADKDRMTRKQQQSARDRRAKAPTTRKAPFDIPEDAKGTKGLNMAKGGMANKPMNAGMKALKKKAPEVAKKMGYRKGGMANCGASMKPTQGSTKSVK